MFFRRRSALLVVCAGVSLALLGTVACTPKVGEPPPPPAGPGGFGNTACISESSIVVQNFFKGEATSGEINSGFDCFEGAFNMFYKYVRGVDKNKYYPFELAEFFEKYFIKKSNSGEPDNKITKNFQIELMKIKQLFVGGSRDYVTRGELARTIGIFKSLRGLAQNLNPYMKIFVLKWKIANDHQQDFSYFEEGNQALQVFSEKLASYFMQDHEPYLFNDFIAFTREMSRFYNQDWSFVATAEKYMPLIYKVKKTVAGGTEDAISPGEWKNFLLLGARAYIQYARYFYFLSSAPESGTSINLSYLTRALEDLFSTFEDLVREKLESRSRRAGPRAGVAGQITRQELFELLTALSQVWPEFKISEPLLEEVMLIKQVLFGGSANNWTDKDFHLGGQKVLKLKPLLEKFFPYFRVYFLEWDASRYQDEEAQIYFKEAQDALQSVATELGTLLEAPYSLGHFGKLISEFKKLYPSEIGSLDMDETFTKYQPLVKSIKNLMYEDLDDSINKAYWPTFLTFGTQIYGFFLNYHYFLKDRTMDESRVLIAFRYWLDTSIHTINSILKIKPSKVIHHQELVGLAKEMKSVGMLPAELTEETLEKTILGILNSILNPPERRLKREMPGTLDKLNLDFLHFELSVWLETEIFIRSLFGENQRGLLFSPYELQKRMDEKLMDPQIGPVLNLGVSELKNIISSPVPLVLNSDGRLVISINGAPSFSGDSVSRMNLTRAVSRWLIRSYADDARRVEKNIGVTKEEAQKAFAELKWPFIDMKILSANNTSFIDSRFMEANIFVPRGDGGEDVASFLELSDLLNMILSGLKLDSNLRPFLLQDCLNGITNPAASTKVDYSCLLKSYRKNIPLTFDSLPDYVSHFKKNSACDTEAVIFNLVKAAGYIPNKNRLVELGDVALLPHVVQYVEMSYARFDLKKDGVLDRFDAKVAFPVFDKLFKKVAKSYLDKGTLKEKDLYALFTYVLKLGAIPSSISELIAFKFWWKNLSEEQRVFQTDRNKLTAILGEVADQVSAKTEISGGKSEAEEIIKSHFSPACRDSAIRTIDFTEAPFLVSPGQ